MAWAVRNSQGEVSWVGFDSGAHLVQTGQSLVEITDDQAIAVMEGRLQMADLFQTARPQQPKPQPRSSAQGLWSRRYPAVMSDRDLDALSQVAKLIPLDSIAVEVGSRLGGSARAIIDHAPRIKRLYCIDPEWKGNSHNGISDPWMDNLRGFWQLDRFQTCLQFAEHYMRDRPQVRLLPFSSPDDIRWWREPVDFMFEDSSHENPQLRDTLDFWVPLVKSGGIIAGHDYSRSNWPEVAQEADALAQRLGTDLHVLGGSTIWWMRKP